jgi:predicted AlkP superfamily phosphohydrolase/phosphomutase
MSVTKLMVIGLDGATWNLMNPWIDAGLLPNLGELRRRGAWGDLASTIQPLSAPAWVSFLTGMQQGKHGIFDFVRRKAGTYNLELTNTTMIQVPTLLEHLGKAGLRTAVINMPFTYPVWPINGVMIGGPFAPSVGPSIVQPSSLWPEIAAAVPGYDILPDYHPRASDPQAKLQADLVACERNRTLAAEFLLRRQDWDAFMVVYTSTDQVQHAFWHELPAELAEEPAPGGQRAKSSAHYRDAILSVYREIDAGVGRLLQYATDETLIVVLSDHGSGRLDWWVHLNRWLADHGYLAYHNQSGNRLPISRAGITDRLVKTYSRTVPQPIRRAMRQALGAKFWTLKERVETLTMASAIDWSHTRVYALGSGDIYVNLKGREPQGTVESGVAYEALRGEVAAELEKLVSPQGQRVVARVYRREELYHGPQAQLGPDLTVVMADHRFHTLARFAPSESVFKDPREWSDARPLSGGHRPEGVVILSGKGVKRGVELQGVRLIDLAPTLMAFAGIPIPAQVDGRVLDEAFHISLAKLQDTAQDGDGSRPGQFSGYTPDEEATVEKRLSDLGYL